MRSTVLARPNLKLFLLGAILIALIQNFIANGRSQATTVHARASHIYSESDTPELLLAEAREKPTAEIYGRISRCYEKQGEMKKALFFLRKAQVLAQFEETND